VDVKERSLLSGDANVRRHPWELARLDVVRTLVRRCLRILPNRSDVVLDIGCGDAFVVQALAREYPAWRFVAMDLAFDHEMIATLRQQTVVPNLEYRRGLDFSAEPGKRPALVLMLDLLEHVQDDAAFLREIVEGGTAAPESVILITVPAMQFLFSSHDVLLNHRRRYELRTLKQTVSGSGLAVTESGYFFASLALARVAGVLFEKLFARKPTPWRGIAGWRGGALVTSLAKRLLLLDFGFCQVLKTFGVQVPGLSCYVICQGRQ